jgi:glyoxylase-like metal-dependent hydrolase (beta-lactamase superfamily II)
VHPIGAPHLAHPAKLLASAARLYGADMARLWGDVHAVPEDRLRPLVEGPLRVAGHDLDVAFTPGHASHHVSYFAPAASIAFIGDTAGICRPGSRIVLPPTPPPDIDLPAWQRSTDRILAWHPEALFLTHFGPHGSAEAHFAELWARMNDWTRRIRLQIQEAGDDDTRAREFTTDVMDEIARATSRKEAQAYADAGRFDFSWSGLARYLRRTTAG